MGCPPTGCNTLEVLEFMRVLSPAARMTATKGTATEASVKSMKNRTYLTTGEPGHLKKMNRPVPARAGARGMEIGTGKPESLPPSSPLFHGRGGGPVPEQ